MEVKVLFLLVVLGLVSLPAVSATVEQQQGEQCVSKVEFDRVAAQTAAVESELDSWQNATINILKRFLLENPALLLETVQNELRHLQDKLQILQYQNQLQQDKTDRLLEELATLKNTSMDGQANLQDKVDTLQDKVVTLQDNLQDKVDTLQDKVVNLQDKLDTFQNTTEASTRKQHHEVVELLQNNTSCSWDGTDELQKQLENITEGLQDQLQTCNRTDISIQYLPASCSEIAELNPHSPPGYYKISTTSGEVQVYCDMERHCCGSTGGWMRAAYLNMTDPTHHCPTGFRLTSHSNRSCERITTPGCTGLTFAVQSVKYSKVCGKVIAYQYASLDAFFPYYENRALTLDGLYVDGVSITHGHPRRHIWTFAGAVDEQQASSYTCPCSKTDTTYAGVVPPFVGNDYFCDTGIRNTWQPRFYPDDPLWDGKGCGPTSSCCSFNSPPWFCKELPQSTTDDIEVRVCTDEPASNEDITIEAVELYVQ